VLLLFVLSAGGCQTQTTEDAQASPKEEAAAAPQRYALHGKVVNLNVENKIAAIDHEEIVGWMGAMTMEFPVRESSEWEKLHVGDQINATVFVDSSGFHLGEIEVVKPPAGEGKTP
jgi:Cu/Ag efflux protein CusF